ncbi:MAG: hypothetical protein DWQ10_11995 [Calditrichaeota bacterium]|nr:MAG: hypothetical protein DWQ10_11995 [Calditrichota bacterium]
MKILTKKHKPMTGLKEIRFIGDLIQKLTDGLERSLTADEIYTKARATGLTIRPEEIKSVLDYLIANEEQIQSIENRYYHQKPQHLRALIFAKHAHE